VTTTSTRPAVAPAKAVKRTSNRQRSACAVLLAPFFLLFVTVFLVPVGTAVWLSFFGADEPGLGFGPERTVFVGLRSYLAVLADPTFLNGLGVIALYCLIYLPLLVVASLGLALLLDSAAARLRSVARLGLFLPHAVPGIIAAIVWLYLYTPGLSPVVDLLGKAGLIVDFLGFHAVLPASSSARRPRPVHCPGRWLPAPARDGRRHCWSGAGATRRRAGPPAGRTWSRWSWGTCAPLVNAGVPVGKGRHPPASRPDHRRRRWARWSTAGPCTAARRLRRGRQAVIGGLPLTSYVM
jgi:hypothetical protein